mgnify:CR=1 FL=1
MAKKVYNPRRCTRRNTWSSKKIRRNLGKISGILKSLTNSDNILSNYIHELTHAYENMYYKKFHKGMDILKIKKIIWKKFLSL